MWLLLSCSDPPSTPVVEETDGPAHDSASQGDWPRSHCDPDGTWEEVHVAWYVGCGRQSDGCVECWGDPWHETTDIDNDNDATRAPPRAFSSVVVPSYEGHHSYDLAPYGCGETADGLFCWGVGQRGQLTDELGLTDLSASFNHVCGLRSDGSVLCVQDHDGSSRFIDRVPLEAGFLDLQVVGSAQACVIRPDASLGCWTNGTDFDSDAWEGVLPERLWNSLGTSPDRLLAIDSEGDVYEWEVTLGEVQRLTAAPNDAFVDAVAVQLDRGCGLTQSGAVRCWGDWSGLEPETLFRQISLGCGVTIEGNIECWDVSGAPAVMEVP